MVKLTLRLLGPPEVYLSRRPVRLRAKKALALLAYLAAEGSPRTRSEIAAFLWPRSDEVRSRSALEGVMNLLRSGLLMRKTRDRQVIEVTE
jgi:DNA-binding SARP family transcriptional activator